MDFFFFEKHGPYNFAQRQGNEKKKKLQELHEDFSDTNIVLAVYVATCIYYVYLHLLC